MHCKVIFLAIALFQASLAYPADPAESTSQDDGSQTPSTSDDSTQTEVSGIIDKGVKGVNNLIKGQADVAKGVLDIISKGTSQGLNIGKQAGKLGSGLAGAALTGGINIGKQGIEAGADITKEALDLTQKVVGQFVPGFVNDGIQKLTEASKNGVDTAKNIGDKVLGAVNSVGGKTLEWIDNKVEGTADSVSSAVSNTNSGLQKTIESSADKITDSINKTLENIKQLLG